MDEQVVCLELEMVRRKFGCFLLLAITWTAQGCGELFTANEPLVIISGRVSYQGQSLVGGALVFSPETAFGSDSDAVATNLSCDGYFVFNQSSQAGLRPGYYRIAVSGTLRNGFHIPRRYHDPATSGLRCKVEPGQPLQLFIQLE